MKTFRVAFLSHLEDEMAAAFGECDWPDDASVDQIIGLDLNVRDICQKSDLLPQWSECIMLLITTGERLRVLLELGDDQTALCDDGAPYNPQYKRLGKVTVIAAIR